MRRLMWMAFSLMGLLSSFGSLDAALNPGIENGSPKVYYAAIKSTINPGVAAYIAHVIKQAEDAKAQAVCLRLDTPGGLLESTRDIVHVISLAQIPVVVYVGPEGARATSAGAFIVLAAHLAVMNQGAHLGAATPVLQGGEELPPTIKAKAISDTRAFIRSIAEKRGRNADVAESFVSDAISLTSTEALSENIIDLEIRAQSELLAKIDGLVLNIDLRQVTLNTADAKIVEVPRRLSDWFLMELAHPQISFLLMTFGLMGIYLEFLNPGLLFPGLAGLVSLITGLILMYALPAKLGFGLLLILGLSLMAIEVYIAGFGALGIIGFLSFLLGSLNLFDDPMIVDFHITVWAVAAGLGLAAVIILVVVRGGWTSMNSSKRLNLIGKHGKVMAEFQGQGYVLIDDKRMTALCQQSLQRNETVKVIEVLANDVIKVVPAVTKRVD